MSKMTFKPNTKVYPKSLEEAVEILDEAKKQGWGGLAKSKKENYMGHIEGGVVLYFFRSFVGWDKIEHDGYTDFEVFEWPSQSPTYPFNVGDTFEVMFKDACEPCFWDAVVSDKTPDRVTLEYPEDGKKISNAITFLLSDKVVIKNYKEVHQETVEINFVDETDYGVTPNEASQETVEDVNHLTSTNTPLALENLSTITTEHSSVSFGIDYGKITLYVEWLEVDVTDLTLEDVKFIVKLVEEGRIK